MVPSRNPLSSEIDLTEIERQIHENYGNTEVPGTTFPLIIGSFCLSESRFGESEVGWEDKTVLVSELSSTVSILENLPILKLL